MSENHVDIRRHLRVQWQRVALVVAVLLVLWLCFRLFSSILLPFVVAAGIAYFLDPMVVRMERLGIRRTFGTLLVLLAFGVAVILFVLLLYPVIAVQAAAFIANLPTYIQTIQADFAKMMQNVQHRLPYNLRIKLQDLASNQAGTLVSYAGKAATNIIGNGFAVVNVLTLLVVTPIVTFYFLRDWPTIIRHVDSWLPRPYEGLIRAQAVEINRILSAWIRGQAICCIALASIYAIGLTIIGLDLGLIVGLAAGLLSFIPYVGTVLGCVTAILLSLSQASGWNGIIKVLIVFAVGQGLNDYVIQPRFLGDRVGLSAVWVIFALFAGGAAFGFLGIMLAVPVTATLGVIARFWLRRYLQSPLYLDAPPE
ncbi:AI-2E family transporter [Acidocella sp.]|uniref:AI-2E family transporter n=1 Tax=Acidocella sp. TaxID=50710 RepID=UPI002638181D|nr:AI-2E family transporter [Acidocella sp.]